MTDATQIPPESSGDEKPNKTGLQATFWQSFDVVKFLAVGCATAYVTMLFIGKQPDETLKNVFLMVIAFYFGSSLGSKLKDRPAAPP